MSSIDTSTTNMNTNNNSINPSDDANTSTRQNLDDIEDFKKYIPSNVLNELTEQIEDFIIRHTVGLSSCTTGSTSTRPICIVSSGGTAVDIEKNTVRTIENFSTGLRGAILIESLLQKGYSIIHLYRPGTASPYGRLISQELHSISSSAISTTNNQKMLQQQQLPNHGLSTTSFGKLFALSDSNELEIEDDDNDDEDDLVQAVLRQEQKYNRNNDDSDDDDDDDNNPWMTDEEKRKRNKQQSTSRTNSDNITLSRTIQKSKRIQKAINNYKKFVLQEQRLLTIPFRTVEEYISRLQLCTELVNTITTSAASNNSNIQSLCMIILAAAVSDYYIPEQYRTEHKIQSSVGNGSKDNTDESNTTNNNTLQLTLYPVPKVIKYIRDTWCPNSFVVSFKLETDVTLLQTKAEMAVQKYHVHLVIGNILQTRYNTVYILSPLHQNILYPLNTTNDWIFHPLHKDETDNYNPDSLEQSMCDFIVQSHFDFISWHYPKSPTCSNSTTSSSNNEQKQTILEKYKQRQIDTQKKQHVQQQKEQRERTIYKVKTLLLEVSGTIIAIVLSYTINTMLQKRLRN